MCKHILKYKCIFILTCLQLFTQLFIFFNWFTKNNCFAVNEFSQCPK